MNSTLQFFKNHVAPILAQRSISSIALTIQKKARSLRYLCFTESAFCSFVLDYLFVVAVELDVVIFIAVVVPVGNSEANASNGNKRSNFHFWEVTVNLIKLMAQDVWAPW